MPMDEEVQNGVPTSNADAETKGVADPAAAPPAATDVTVKVVKTQTHVRNSEGVLQLPQPPRVDGPLAELSFGKLTATIEWLMTAVTILHSSVSEVSVRLTSEKGSYDARFEHLDHLLIEIQNRTPPRRSPSSSSSERDLPPPVQDLPPPVQVGSQEPPPQEPVAKIDPADFVTVASFQNRANEMGFAKEEAVTGLAKKCEALKDVDATHNKAIKRIEQRLDNMVLEMGGLVKIKDFEDQKAAVNKMVPEMVEKAVGEVRRQAEEENKKVRHRLGEAEELLKKLNTKNERDGDVAGRLRDLALKVDGVEQQVLEHAEEIEEQARIRELAKQSSKNKDGAVSLDSLARVELEEEVRRLRSSVECMEQSMSQELRATVDFFKKDKENSNGNSQGQLRRATTEGPRTSQVGMGGSLRKSQTLAMTPTSPTLTRQSTSLAASPVAVKDGSVDVSKHVEQAISIMRDDTQDLLQRCEELYGQHQKSLFKAVRSQQQEVSRLEAKIEDMWKRLPKVIALLEPIQAQTNSGGINVASGASTGSAAVAGGNKSSGNKASGTLTSGTTTGGITSVTGISTTGTSTAGTANLQEAGSTHGGSDAALQAAAPGERSPDVATRRPSAQDEIHAITGLVQSTVRSTIENHKGDLERDIEELKADVQNLLSSKAGAHEVAALSSKLESWTQHAPGCARYRERARERDREKDKDKDRDRDHSEGSRVPDPPSSPAQSPDLKRTRSRYLTSDPDRKGCGHDKCKNPTCPRSLAMSQSLSRLPALKEKVPSVLMTAG